VPELPGNSREERERKIVVEVPAEAIDELNEIAGEQHRTRRIVDNGVVRRPKSIGNKVADLLGGLFGGLAKDVLIPALKDTARDFVYQGIDRALYRDDDRPPVHGSRHNSRVSSTIHTPYNQMSRDRPSPRSSRVVVEPLDLGEIILSSATQAEEVKREMAFVLDKYGVVTVADLNHMLGERSNPQDHNWGWFDLDGVRVRRERNGYRLILPQVEDVH
jgi:hypothetical protein